MVKKFSDTSFRFKILSSLILTLGIVFVFIFAYYPIAESKISTRTMMEKNNFLGEMIAMGVGIGMETSDFEVILAAMDLVKKDPDLEFIIVLDEYSEEYASYNPHNQNFDIPFLLNNEGINNFGNKKIYLTIKPIDFHEKNLGDLVLGISLDSHKMMIRKHTRTSLLFISVIFLISILLAVLLSRQISKPLIALGKSVRQISTGNYNLDINS